MAILELGGHVRGKDRERFTLAVNDLKASTIGDYPIMYVSTDSTTFENAGTVPDFGHDYRCKCENPEPWGVRRYFGVTLYVEGSPSPDDLFGDYSIPNGRLIVTGIALPRFSPDAADRRQLRVISQQQAAA
jgi:hypothetical protein